MISCVNIHVCKLLCPDHQGVLITLLQIVLTSEVCPDFQGLYIGIVKQHIISHPISSLSANRSLLSPTDNPTYDGAHIITSK